ncbi:uncharacterized protein BO97DRAFT_148595 [Aspergillus homomorphus CBS 101889]|uniref:Uncharacterized protein n=1 Tax=Aspergillus homomorphus (strain CBS 101889) TaxID=1450537 RepID=A0A395HRI1_ASPHC|nr:hypothetical protein BO97DRAFT_148595 [Aspergillus homomorphus CBS 101889]RAL10099.1 hypothetical protein BO97DRAFT_148595 [Aspergillus homomorphus CBS 101889]
MLFLLLVCLSRAHRWSRLPVCMHCTGAVRVFIADQVLSYSTSLSRPLSAARLIFSAFFSLFCSVPPFLMSGSDSVGKMSSLALQPALCRWSRPDEPPLRQHHFFPLGEEANLFPHGRCIASLWFDCKPEDPSPAERLKS